MTLTTTDIEIKHYRCPVKCIGSKSSPEYEEAKYRSIVFYGTTCIVCRPPREDRRNTHAWPTDFHHIIRRKTHKGMPTLYSGRETLCNFVPMCRQCHTDNPLYPKDIQALSELPQFSTFMEKVNV